MYFLFCIALVWSLSYWFSCFKFVLLLGFGFLLLSLFFYLFEREEEDEIGCVGIVGGSRSLGGGERI